MRTAALALVAALTLSLSAFAAGKVVTASDRSTKMTVPDHWTDLELNENAEIQVGYEKDDAYVIVLNESKQDLSGWNLDKHSRVTLGNLLSRLDLPTVTGPKTLTVGGSPAVQYEVHGASDGTNIIYVHTTVDGPRYFSQVLAWTLPSRAAKVLPQLREAVTTLREIDE